MSIYSLGIPLGKLVGMAVGGMVAQALGWRMAFILVGAPGLLLAALTWFTLPEPRQVVSAPPAVKAPPQLALGAMFRGLAPVRTFWWISLGGAFMSFVSYGQTAFMGSFFIRVHGLSVGEAGLMLGLALGAGGALGTWFGGRFADWGARRDRRAYVLIPAAAAALGGVLFAVAVLTPATAPALMILACGGVMNSVWYGPVFATVQGLVPATQRATAAAVHLFIINLIGLGFGPLAFGALSDLLNVGWPGFAGFGPELGLRYALACGSFLAFLALLAFWKASQTIRQELDVQDA
jgi:predicted MFS family arabinose efflux permease